MFLRNQLGHFRLSELTLMIVNRNIILLIINEIEIKTKYVHKN